MKLRLWVLLRLPVPVLVAVLAPSLVGGLLGERLTELAYAHGAVKSGILVWQSMLVREVRLAAFLATIVLAGLILPGLKGRVWAVGALGVAVATVGLLAPLAWWTVPVALAWLAVNLAPAQTLARWGARWRPVAWIPGTELLFGGPVSAAIGAGPRLLRVAGAMSALTIGGAWILADALGAFWEYEQVVFAPWPDERVDPRVTTIARAPAGEKCDFHDIDIVGSRAVVVAEASRQLLSVPAVGEPVAWPLPPNWGEMIGLVMDSETDAVTNTSWYLSGPKTVTGVQWDNGWKKVAESASISGYLHHTYMHWLRERETLYVFSIGTKNTVEDPVMVELDTPGLQVPKVRHLKLPGGGKAPTFRDLAWVPVLGRFVMAPDFGTRLYLVEPGNAFVTPWMEMPTLNGRLIWVGGMDRLVIPMPNLPELWIVDPKTASVERKIPTQPGVRAVAVDVARNVFLTASVLTGRVLVQDLDDGTVLDSFGTVMPMARNLAIFPDRGEAILTTWTAMYRIPYAASLMGQK